MTPIGINWKAVWKQVWKTVWRQTAPVPPPVPATEPRPATVGGGQDDYYERLAWEQQIKRRIEAQNQDDFEVIRILTEFLSRM